MPYKDPEKAREFNRKWRAANPEKQREYHKKYRAANPEKLKETKKKWYAANPEKGREANRKWRAANPEKKKELNRKWYAANSEKAREFNRKWRAANPEKARETNRKWAAYKRATDPNFRLIRNMRNSLSKALRGRSKSASTMKIIGCTVEELFEHFESCSTWEPWMTRENYGRGGWDVDHIIAIAKWDQNCPVQFAKCWHKSNLQPLEHIANIKKGAR
tara:strand:+ start:111 stop:764 length:654 start_codon:yes stop_codon:yes gene_type:complete